MMYGLVLIVLVMWAGASPQSQEEMASDTVALVPEDTLSLGEADTTFQEGLVGTDTVEQQELTGLGGESEVGEEEALSDTAGLAGLEEVPPTLDAGYKGFAWGMKRDQFNNYVKADSVIRVQDGESISVYGTLGEDTVSFTYYFSDKGFWKVRIDYDVQGEQMSDYADHFHRIEKLLTKRYGIPMRTTQNDLGTDREYLFSDFPKLARAYFRSSWIVDSVRIELLLDAVTPHDSGNLPVFQDMRSVLRLYYYSPSFYGQSEPEMSEIPEETLIEVY